MPWRAGTPTKRRVPTDRDRRDEEAPRGVTATASGEVWKGRQGALSWRLDGLAALPPGSLINDLGETC
jgi:hypothetical protein